jgi:type I restriction enzyme S subunit
MSKYKRYERYKDSGVEWIGEIPEHWELECSLDDENRAAIFTRKCRIYVIVEIHPIPKLYAIPANKFSKVNDILLSVRAPVGAMNISDRVYGIGRGLCANYGKQKFK